ncbi:MAG: amidohydrolase [Streptosporangiales bacterium]|jgi:predicted TIM-barrel fold metal-dependent hydrolase|nr:amidohydrolase [Streptosporangiales bacterium]
MPYKLISADDHCDLSHDDIKSHLDPVFHDDYNNALRAFGASMKAMRSMDTNQAWRDQNGLKGPSETSMTVRPKTGNPAFGRSGHTVNTDRLADMDTDGVQASSTYSEVSAFRYLYMLKNGWKEATRAFNQTLLDFAAPAPDRLVVSFQIPIHDIDAAVEEVKWAKQVGCKSLQLPVFPVELGLPDYWDTRYDPLWRVISDSGLPIAFHIGLNTQLEGLAERDPTPQKGIFVAMTALSTGEPLGMLVLTGLLERFPDLKILFVEPGVGWVSWWLDIADDLAARQGYDFPGLKKAPSDYFRQNIKVTFIDERDVIRFARDTIGVENVLWSSDYPHPVTSWPNSQKIAEEVTQGMTDAEREMVLSGNAIRLWNL